LTTACARARPMARAPSRRPAAQAAEATTPAPAPAPRAQPVGRPVLQENAASALARKAGGVLRSSPGGPNSRVPAARAAPDCGAQRHREGLSGEKPAPVESAAPKVQIQIARQPSPLRAEVRHRGATPLMCCGLRSP